MLSLTWILAFASTADAAPVLHADDDPDAVARAAQRNGGGAAESWPLSQLLGAVPAVLVEGASVLSCDGASLSSEDLGARLDKAKGQLVYMQYSEAAADLDTLRQQLPCLAEAADSDQLARLGLFRGFAAASEGLEADAVEAFGEALSADPALVWDTDLPESGRELMEGLSELAEAPAQLGVHPADGVVLVDGRRVDGKVELRAGAHLLQVVVGDGWSTMRIDVAAGADVRVVAPHAAGSDVLGWPADPAGQNALDQLLAVEGSDPDPVFVVDGQDVWNRSAGAWVSLDAPTRERSIPVKSITRWGGAGLLAAGAGVAAVSYRNGLNAHGRGVAAIDDADEAAYLAAKPDYDGASRWLVVGDAAVVTGAAMVGVSFLW